ncbi:MAG: uracil-DNA glycosylase, partial [Halothiobacillaceae bacterium]
VWGRTPQREQRHQSLIRGVRRGHAPRRDELKKSKDGFFQSFPEARPLPKSLQNIFKELEEDLGIRNTCGSLMPWADQGVLLLNAVLTVESGKSASHHGKGWERFTDRAVQVLNDQEWPLAFVLWGRPAQQKGAHIDRARHLVLEAAHPSPLSAHRGFFGSRPFSKINAFLESHGQPPIDWRT